MSETLDQVGMPDDGRVAAWLDSGLVILEKCANGLEDTREEADHVLEYEKDFGVSPARLHDIIRYSNRYDSSE